MPRGETPRPGPQIDRQTSCPVGGPTTLKKMAERNYDYRPHVDGDGRRRGAMKDVLKIIVAIIVIVIGLEILKD